MIRNLLILAVLCSWVVGLGLSPLSAEPSPQQKLMAKRAAELDAYRKLAEQIMGLQISATSHVKDFVTVNDRVATAFDQFLKGVRFTDVRYFDDGTAETDAQVTIEQLVTTLKKICSEVYQGGQWKKEVFEEITRNTQRSVISVTGVGAITPHTNLPDPVKEDVKIAGPVAKTGIIALAIPEIFRKQAPAERLKAKRAAELDAYRKLFERVYGFAIASQTLVEDFTTKKDVIRTAMEGHLKGVKFDAVRYNEDGTVEVEAQMTIEQVVTTIQRTADMVFEKGRWNQDVYEKIQRESQRKVIAVVGVGALDTSAPGTPAPGTPGTPAGQGGTRRIDGPPTVIVD